jgi:hypothetical protein
MDPLSNSGDPNCYIVPEGPWSHLPGTTSTGHKVLWGFFFTIFFIIFLKVLISIKFFFKPGFPFVIDGEAAREISTFSAVSAPAGVLEPPV